MEVEEEVEVEVKVKVKKIMVTMSGFWPPTGAFSIFATQELYFIRKRNPSYLPDKQHLTPVEQSMFSPDILKTQ